MTVRFNKSVFRRPLDFVCSLTTRNTTRPKSQAHKTKCLVLYWLFCTVGVALASEPYSIEQPDSKKMLALPPPRLDGAVSLENSMHVRRSIRRFSSEPLKLSDIAQILWAAQGVTSPNGHRTSPSAGALYPLEIYLISGRQPELMAGVYRYQPSGHSLLQISMGDLRTKLARAGHRQSAISEAPATVAIFAVFERTTAKYGNRGRRYVHLEAGHSAQNISLQAVALGLGSVVIGAFHDSEIQHLIGAVHNERPLYLIPIGTPK